MALMSHMSMNYIYVNFYSVESNFNDFIKHK